MKKIYSISSIGKLLLLPILAVTLMALPDTASAQATGQTITGVVTDAQTQTPVVGAVVAIKGAGRSTGTNVDGKYTLSNVEPSAVLVVSFLGYKTQEVAVGQQTQINVALDEDHLNLDEVVVIGYGTTKKANLTGSVATINVKQMDTRPLQSVSQALQGTVPGVVAVQASGQPGSQTASVTIRGKNSINDNGPLVIIDGVPGNMNSMDPNDVESMSILKDAASAAIYGVQAASGVILITTKKGSRNKPASVTYTGNVAFATPTAIPNYLGSYDYARLYNEAQRNDANNPDYAVRYSESDLQKFADGSAPYTHANTDWYAATFRTWTTETQHTVNVNGGTEKTTYSGSMGMLYQDGKTINNSYNRYNARFNVETQATKWLKIGMNLAGYTATNKTGWTSPAGLVQYANRLTPTIPVYNEDGTFNGSLYQNPVAEMDLDGWRKYQQTEYTANAYAQINFFPTLSVKGLYSYRGYTGHDTGFHRVYSYGTQKSTFREAYDNNNQQNRETIQLLLNYDESFGKHNVSFLAGFEQYQLQYRWANASRSRGGSNELQESISTLDPDYQLASGAGNDLARQSFFGRLQYNFAGKYFIEGNFRADASSRFAPNQRWGYFPSVSAAWRITEEEFMKNISWLSNLKLRAGYGVTGNEEVEGNYDWQNTYGYDKYLFNDAAYQTIKESRYANSELTWATVTNIEGAIEASFLNNAVGFEVAVYNKMTDGMLLKLSQPAVLGATPPYQNAGKVRNFGIDMSVFHNGRAGDFSYNISLNAGYVKNELIELKNTDGEVSKGSIDWYITGQPIGTYYGYKATGLFREQSEITAATRRTASDRVGNLRFEDVNGDGKITADDRTVIGYNFPKWTAGLSFTANWKNIEFNVLFQGAFDVTRYMTGEASYGFFNGGKVLERHLDAWSLNNPNGNFPRLTFSGSSVDYVNNSYWLADASYVRLKNLTLSYSLPQAWMNAIKMQTIKVYFTGENLWTIKSKDMAGWDPESPSGRGAMYANVLKLSMGLRVTF